MAKEIEQTYKRFQQDIYNVMDLLREELDRDEIEGKHLPQIDHIKRSMVELYRSASSKQTGEIYDRLEAYRQTDTYPGFQDDLDQLADRVKHFQSEYDALGMTGEVGLFRYCKDSAEELSHILDDINGGVNDSAFEDIQNLPYPVADHVPQRLYDFLSRYG